ncbi:hypothetical protein VUR80DRAFT_7684 [Thermomyces stellatus]
MDQPPPPPPHGGVPKSSGLPPGKYDIFVIPQHSSGSGFLYLPSLQPNINSFAAGFACGLVVVVLFQNMAPAFQAWWSNYQGMGGPAMALLTVGVGVGAWALGRTQQNKTSTPPPRTEHSFGYGGAGGSSGTFPGASSGAGPAPNPGPGPGTADGPPPPPPPHSDPPPYSGSPPHSASNSAPPPHSNSNAAPPPHSSSNSAPPPHSASNSAPPPRPEKPASSPKAEKPKPTWQRQQSNTPKTEAPKGSWEKAREETRRREDERKAKEEEQKRKEEEQKRKEEEQKRKDEAAKKLREQREREAKEREQREQREREAKEREQREREARERRERLEAERRERMEIEKREKELREKLEQERLEKERLQREKEEREKAERLEKERLEKLERERVERLEREKFIREAREREARERAAREKDLEEMRKREEEETKAAKKASTYAFSGVGERTNPWPNGKPRAPPAAAPSSCSAPPKPAPSTAFTSPNDDQRAPPAPSVNTSTGTEEEMYSYRPYDKPKQAGRRKNSLSEFSDTSWTPSHTTARTSPPPSMRAPYTTKDPDKIVIKAVYLYLNQFSKTPVSQLVSGVGSVTDGLILRATTEGLFIDDDVRGVPQREWDVKAWTLKQVEVWCPPHCLTPSPHTPGTSASKSSASASSKVRDRAVPRLFTGDDADSYLTEMLRACKDCCRLGLCEATFRNTNVPSPTGQTGEWRAKGLHLLRATIRDQEGKRYLFVIGEEESWKVAVGLQRLRRGTQARALGVGALSSADARGALEMLGWA